MGSPAAGRGLPESMRLAIFVIVGFVFASPAAAFDFTPRQFTIYGGGGKSVTTPHGQASFRTLQFELLGDWRLVTRWIPKAMAGVSVSYHDIRQARSWFGYTYGDPNDSVRGESAYFFVRRAWRQQKTTQPYLEIGTGPMWSNRRVPAATSRFNFNSQLGLGTILFADRHPLYVVVRLGHISNGTFAGRNPGWNVTSLLAGTRVHKFRQ